MYTKLLPLLNVVLKKYPVPVVGAILLTTVIMIILPDGWSPIRKVGTSGIAGGVFCSSLLLILWIMTWGAKYKKRRDAKRIKLQKLQDCINQVMTAFDKCSQQQRGMAYKFLGNGNTPLLLVGSPYPLGCDALWAKNIDYALQNGYYQVRLKDDFYHLLSYIYSQYGRISRFDVESPEIGGVYVGLPVAETSRVQKNKD